ncbi:hypothetical protein PPL_08717 [Heterostelium album PN500]|uniref:Uncharacterized protein n=1 Tax=Heterostelium pallidum (strain ATCC 26659 / Pp 5 / PN500) TaxID=670386 RepID=D3BJJ0_HETP5|nr:hypothetical protein PPL_08717 [Heterostelium album PN500]EFA78070.1 hypothetical protein PPL_08717 [Heterostelium album PN500]|eukprot:XP_020430197.1 hypothetical protein PPL_08717 [Heterostelium album PN500]
MEFNLEYMSELNFDLEQFMHEQSLNVTNTSKSIGNNQVEYNKFVNHIKRLYNANIEKTEQDFEILKLRVIEAAGDELLKYTKEIEQMFKEKDLIVGRKKRRPSSAISKKWHSEPLFDGQSAYQDQFIASLCCVSTSKLCEMKSNRKRTGTTTKKKSVSKPKAVKTSKKQSLDPD